MFDPPVLTPAAARVLRAQTPGRPAYMSWALGPPKGVADLGPIDAAYAELVVYGLAEAADRGAVTVLPGAERRPFVLTPDGERARARLVPSRAA
ncbi:MAG TPA: hypothetical protein VM597_26795 [Gemmataceae bacterium]|jgi:hypothetical protein|nr:hypothetical protein [Gemmataceae bacterium]